jgi:hypothetical protein
LKIFLRPKKVGFLGKTFFGCTYYEGHMYIFEISMNRRIFDTPFDLIKEKNLMPDIWASKSLVPTLQPSQKFIAQQLRRKVAYLLVEVRGHLRHLHSGAAHSERHAGRSARHQAGATHTHTVH